MSGRSRPVVKAFCAAIGLDELPGADSREGVVLDWAQLPEAVAEETRGFAPSSEGVGLRAPGLMEAAWSWTRSEEQLWLEVVVSSQGAAAPREELVERCATSSRAPIPFTRDLSGPGDLAVRSDPPVAILWVFRNVCLALRSDGAEIPLDDLARAVQRAMERHLVADLSAHLPRPTSVDVFPARVRVGQRVTVAVRGPLPSTTVLDIERGDRALLGPPTRTPDGAGGATLEALAPGRAAVMVKIGDERTLLTAFHALEVEVLPADAAAP